MKPKLDWEATAIALVGIMVFFILMIGAERAVGAPRLIPPTLEEKICVNYIGMFILYQTSPQDSTVEASAIKAIKSMELGELTIQGITTIQRGTGTGTVLPILYKQCLAIKGEVV